MTTETYCYKCNYLLKFEVGDKVGRHEECTQCYANIRSCKMCSFYDLAAYNECREPMATRILEKEKANFCDFYKVGSQKSTIEAKDSLVSAANSLFKS